MPLKLLSPRKTGREFWYLRGVHCGKRHFFSTKLREDPRKTNPNYVRDAEKRIEQQQNGVGRVTFALAAQKYMDWRNPSERDVKFIEAVISEIGSMFIGDITQDDIFVTASALYPNTKASTRNRAVIRPIAAVMHYAAKNKWCEWLRIDTFKEEPPQTRYVTKEDEKGLHAGLRSKGTHKRVAKRLFLLWLFRHADRTDDAVRADYKDLDFNRMVFRTYVSKSKRYIERPMDPVIGRYLRLTGIKEGRIFPWATRFGPHQWIAELSKKTGIPFTAHQARHTRGKRLNDSGAGLKTIMQFLGQTDPKSAIRYQSTDIEAMRLAAKKAR